jgi:hypothetical protein
MRNIADNPDEAASRTRASRAFIENQFGANVGPMIAERLEAIRLSRLTNRPANGVI